MKRIFTLFLLLCLILSGCAVDGTPVSEESLVVTTTAPVTQFTAAITEGSGIRVEPLITEAVSCLHDYSLSTAQMKLLQSANVVVISGMGLEDAMEDVLKTTEDIIDASRGVDTLLSHHGVDPHIWLDPDRAEDMAENICEELTLRYPQHALLFEKNLDALERRFDALDDYGESRLRQLSSRQLVTFHDGFAYFADAMDLTIAAVMEEESGSEVSAKDLISVIELVKQKNLPAVFTEINGSEKAASVVREETGCSVYALDTAMGGSDYFVAMEHNIDTVWEALG